MGDHFAFGSTLNYFYMGWSNVILKQVFFYLNKNLSIVMLTVRKYPPVHDAIKQIGHQLTSSISPHIEFPNEDNHMDRLISHSITI